ncbi:MAG: hypothetical protein KatS3mg035_2209 [Bacteroidia bacterium]|nr:MAG: hypothetical protein KatS3mg035_2209 [Bacteroidia bacterium]
MNNFESVFKISVFFVFFLFAFDLAGLVFFIIKRKQKNFKKILAISLGLNLLILTLIALSIFWSLEKTPPKIIYTYPDTETKWDNYDQPIVVEFNTPVQKRKLDPSINPNIQGYWVWKDFLGIPSLTKIGYFYPEQSTFNDQRIVIYITGISRPLKNENHEYGFVFDSPNLPMLTYSTPFNGDIEVPIDTDLELNFNKPNTGYAEFSYSIEPEIKFTIQETSPTQILVNFEEDLQQSQKYVFKMQVRSLKKNFKTGEILETTNFEDAARIAFYTKREPLIKSFSPTGTGALQDTDILIRFEVPMNSESVLEKLDITPTINFDYEWNERLDLLKITPTDPLPKDTSFKVTLKQGVLSKSGGISTKDITYEFKTIGPIIVKSVEPQNNSSNVNENSIIKVTFDQAVSRESAQSKFSITPNVSGSFEWENDFTMIFRPNKLNFSTTYTVKINTGIESIYGLPNTEEFSSTFTVRSNQIIIQMPQYFQPQSPPSFSCNVYAARMALAWKGYNVGIISLIAEMGYNDGYQNGHWLGNPYKEYVGNYDGSWGYGVYWDPIQKLFTNRGIQTELYKGWNLSGLAKAVEQGHPVIIWRYNGESANYDKNWVAQDGTYVVGINGQHGGVVTGFRGSSDNPTHIFLNDPWYGKIWIQASLFDYYWSRLGRVGLVIY